MQFGIFYEHQLPRPWQEDSEARLIREALAQVELADRVGIDYVWEVEHHFLEEYSHSSAPEVFLAACSQRTKRMRVGHGGRDGRLPDRSAGQGSDVAGGHRAGCEHAGDAALPRVQGTMVRNAL